MPPTFTRDIQRMLLLNTSTLPLPYSYGTFTLYGPPFQVTFGFSRWEVRGSTPHLPYVPIRDSVCPLPLSIAFTEGISSISFPAGTKMLQSPAFPAITGLSIWRRKSDSAITGSQVSCASPVHIAA